MCVNAIAELATIFKHARSWNHFFSLNITDHKLCAIAGVKIFRPGGNNGNY